MALYAIDDLDDAYGVTRRFLGDIGRRTWLKLAFVVFFIGGAGGGFPGFTSSFGGDAGPGPGGEFPAFDPGPDFWLIVAAVVAALVIVALLFALVGAIMEFVFVESLRREVVSVREYWDRHRRKGVYLFGFRLVLALIPIGLVLFTVGLFVLPLVFETAVIGAPLFLLVVLIPAIIAVSILFGVIDGFTTAFVVPIMILENCGVRDGWRRLWPTIKAQWKQYLAYVVASWILTVVAGMVAFIAIAILGALLLVPFGVLGAIGFVLFTVAAPVGIALLVLTGVLFAVAMLVVVALVQVPIQTYLRYYALLVLGDVEDAFDIIPDQRAVVRELDESP